MMLTIELKKLRRTGVLPALLGAAALASAAAAVNMAARGEIYLAQDGAALDILLSANWQLMSMLNVLALLCAACLMYNSEHANAALEKMEVLPLRPGAVFTGKAAALALALALMLAAETSALAVCAAAWFGSPPDAAALCGLWAFELAAALPTLLTALIVASLYSSVWVSLGIGLTLVFTLSVFPQDNALVRILPFASPYQTPGGDALLFAGACVLESAVLFILGPALGRAGRWFA